MDIEWREGEVCFADGEGHHPSRAGFVEDYQSFETSFLNIMNYSDFQLNTIKQGDYISKSELDTEDKYNRAVEAFGLFGFAVWRFNSGFKRIGKFTGLGVNSEGEVLNYEESCRRKITFNQLIAIGELKRLMNERDNALIDAVESTSILRDTLNGSHSDKPSSVSKVNRDIERPASNDQVKKPSHYQLIEGVESIEIIARSMTKEQWHGFCLGNMLKYRIRAGKKDKLQQDIDKANFYGELYEMHKEKCYDK